MSIPRRFSLGVKYSTQTNSQVGSFRGVRTATPRTPEMPPRVGRGGGDTLPKFQKVCAFPASAPWARFPGGTLGTPSRATLQSGAFGATRAPLPSPRPRAARARPTASPPAAQRGGAAPPPPWPPRPPGRRAANRGRAVLRAAGGAVRGLGPGRERSSCLKGRRGTWLGRSPRPPGRGSEAGRLRSASAAASARQAGDRSRRAGTRSHGRGGARPGKRGARAPRRAGPAAWSARPAGALVGVRAACRPSGRAAQTPGRASGRPDVGPPRAAPAGGAGPCARAQRPAPHPLSRGRPGGPEAGRGGPQPRV